MMKLHPYLSYGGNCEEAFRFYEKHLGGKIQMILRYEDQPEPKNFPPGSEKAILSMNMTIGETQLMGNDMPKERFEPIRSAYLTLSFDNSEEAQHVYAVLSEGGEVFMPMMEMFFAYQFAMLRDRFGTLWMLLHPKPAPANG